MPLLLLMLVLLLLLRLLLAITINNRIINNIRLDRDILTLPVQIYLNHENENEKKLLHSSRVLDTEQRTFTPLIFTSMDRKECLQYHSRLVHLISIKKGEDYAQTISWIRARTSFALSRSRLICHRGSRARRNAFYDFKNIDIDIEIQDGATKIILRKIHNIPCRIRHYLFTM